jgi:uncharacterized DUF497 family protein
MTDPYDLHAERAIIADLEHVDVLKRELAIARVQRDRLAVICGELIAAVRVNSMRDTFREATVEQIEEWLDQWVSRLAAVKGGGE